jgi:hypothetical protein
VGGSDDQDVETALFEGQDFLRDKVSDSRG